MSRFFDKILSKYLRDDYVTGCLLDYPYFWYVFDIFDHRKFPQSVTEISSYGNREITVLIDHYGKEKASTYKSVTINQVGDIDGVAAIQPRDFEILGWCPAGPVLPHGEKVPL